LVCDYLDEMRLSLLPWLARSRRRNHGDAAAMPSPGVTENENDRLVLVVSAWRSGLDARCPGRARVPPVGPHDTGKNNNEVIYTAVILADMAIAM